MNLRLIYTIKSLGLAVVLMLVSSFAWGQKTISGVVKDVNNEPLIGVSVLVKGTTMGTITDFDGSYTALNVPENGVLTFSYVGYATQEISVIGKTTIDVTLVETITTLNDVLVIGYGTIKKSDKTGAVTSVTATELNTGRLSDPIEALQGKAAGVLISKQGGDPNAGFAVNIRGASSFSSGTGPLFVVDGVPGVDPTTIAPQDIESYNVLKDASSTSIYGARGANGVIIITTKNGKLGNKEGELFGIEYSTQLSVDRVAKKYDLLSAQEIRDFAQKTGRTFIDNGANVDWQDEIFRTGLTQDHNLSFSSSRQTSSFRATLSHMDIEGVIKGSSKTRNIGRLNYSQTAFDGNVNIEARLSGTIEKNDYVNYGGFSPDNVIYQALRRSPTDKIRNDDGSFYETDRSFQYFNPLAIIEDYQNERDAKRLLGNISMSVNLLKDLKGWVNLAYTRNDDESFYFVPKSTASTLTSGFGRRAYNNYSNRLLESTLTYAPKIKEGHTFSVLGGYSYQKDGFDGFSVQGTNATSDYIKSYNLRHLLTLDAYAIDGYKREDILISFFARALYDINSKYYFSASLRRDGSSKFGANNQWGWFPSASLGWNLHEENFLKRYRALDQLKVRASYGVSGNQNIPSDGDKVLYGVDQQLLNPETGEKVWSYLVSGQRNPNPDLKWEENQEVNLGIDFGFFKSRLSGSIEVYRRTIKDLIYGFQVPVPPNKQRTTLANSGSIRNQGIELTAQYYVITRPTLKWRTLLTFSANRQKTISLGDNGVYKLGEIPTLYVSGRGLVGGINNAQVIRPGLAVGTFVMPEYVGLSTDGKFLFKTAEGGVTRDVSKAERRVVGSAQPKFQAGWSNFFTFGKFDASASFRTIIGYDVLNVTKMVFSNPADLPTLNTLRSALDEYNRGLTSGPTLSSYYLEDASFLRLDNISLGYNFDLNRKYLKNIRFYVTATNLFVITKYSGIDPEIAFGGTEFGRDQYDVYPRTRTVTAGFNIKF